MKIQTFLFCSFCCFPILSSAVSAQETTPFIKFTPDSPFTADGKRIEKIWENADQLGCFNIPAKATVAVYQTTAQMLYDKSCLYISFKARIEPSAAGNKIKTTLWRDSNFEIFLKPEKSSDTYYHIAVSTGGEIYFSKNGMVSNKHQIRTVSYSISIYRYTNVTIPLPEIGMNIDALDGKKILFNLASNNVDIPGGVSEASSYAVLEVHNYHNPETWAECIFTKEAFPSRLVRHTSPNIRLNLLPNPEFTVVVNEKPVGWNLQKDVGRSETILYSNTWKVSATGEAHAAMTNGGATDAFLIPGKEYTFCIRARRVGGDGGTGIISLVTKPGGGTKGGTHIGWNTALTDEWHDYYFPFKMDKDFYSFAFYRLAADPKSSVEFLSICLYEGKISPFELRSITNNEMKKPVPGTEIALPVNIFGKGREKYSILDVGVRTSGMTNAVREVAEIINGLNAEYDCLATSGKNTDMYYTKSDTKEVMRKLQKGEYDIYLLGNEAFDDSLPARMGKKLSAKIIENVENGATLILMKTSNYAHFSDFLKKYPPQKVVPGHYLKHSLPLGMFKLNEKRQNEGKKTNPLADICEVKCGKGRLILIDTASKDMHIQILNDDEESLFSKFPYEKYTNVWFARLFAYAAGKMSSMDISSIAENAEGAEAVSNGMPDGTKAFWRVTSKDGEEAISGETFVRSNRISIMFDKSNIMTGKYLVEIWARDTAGNTLDYANETFEKNGPAISELKDRKIFYSGNDKGEFYMKVSEAVKGMTVEWNLEDFSGRILEHGNFNAAPEFTFTVPLIHAYTNLMNLEVRLLKQGRILDLRRLAVFVQDRDRNRLHSDYFVQAWGFEQTSRFTAEQIEKQLETIGILAYDHSNQFSALKSGKSSIKLGTGSSAFIALPNAEDHIRRFELNTAAARKKIAEWTKTRVREWRKYGYGAYAQCDESELADPLVTDQEVDSTPENVAEYRKRMKVKYGDITAFNQCCETNYKSFDELSPCLAADAKKSGKFGEFIEWRTFNVDRWTEAHRLVADTVKAEDPGAPFSLQNSYGQSVFGGNDYWKLLRHAGFDYSTEYGIYNSSGRENPIRHLDEFVRSFRPDIINRMFGGFSQKREYAWYMPWRMALHRFGGFTHFCSTQNNWRILDSAPAYGITRFGAEYMRSLKDSRLLDGMGKLFREYEWAKRDIAVYYSQSSMYMAFLIGPEKRSFEVWKNSPLYNYYYGRQNLEYLLERLLYQYDFVSYEQVEKGILNNYKVLFMPSVISISDKEIDAIRKFIKNGGKVIADFPPGTYDAVGMKRNQAPLDETTVLGKVFDDKNAAMRGKIASLLAGSGVNQVLTASDSLAGREVMHFVDGKMHLFAILRDPYEADDNEEQTFRFPVKGHVYDLRVGKYLGVTDTVTCRIPNDQAAVYGVYPYRIESLRVTLPSVIRGGEDLKASICIVPSAGTAGKHIFHIEVINPRGEARFFMKRNVTAEKGKYDFTFHMAFNDPCGKWKLKVTDVLSGITEVREFELKKAD